MKLYNLVLKTLKKVVLLILRAIYLIFLFIWLCIMILLLTSSLTYIFSDSPLDVDVAIAISFLNGLCLIVNLIASLISYKIDKFTFKCHMVMAGICAVCVAPPWVALLFV